MFKNNNPNYNVVKRTSKFLSTSPDLKIVRVILKNSSDKVICAICNVSLNARQGEVVLTPTLKHFYTDTTAISTV